MRQRHECRTVGRGKTARNTTAAASAFRASWDTATRLASVRQVCSLQPNALTRSPPADGHPTRIPCPGQLESLVQRRTRFCRCLESCNRQQATDPGQTLSQGRYHTDIRSPRTNQITCIRTLRLLPAISRPDRLVGQESRQTDPFELWNKTTPFSNCHYRS
jgi:hypothetical protein